MFVVESINNNLICIKGIGKMFYQDGFPISMAVDYLKSKCIKVSILHVADECLKNGWPPETVIKKFKEDFNDSGNDNTLDIDLLRRFCNSSYEDQREMIFNYLFNSKEDAINWLKERILS